MSEDEAFCAGLLHDIGALVLDTSFPAEYERVRHKMRDEGLHRHESELEVFGVITLKPACGWPSAGSCQMRSFQE